MGIEQERSSELDALVSAIGTASGETLLELRDFLLNGPNGKCSRSFDATPRVYRCRSEVLPGGR